MNAIDDLSNSQVSADITDIHVLADSPDASLFFPGPRPAVGEDERLVANQLAALCRTASPVGNDAKLDFSISLDDMNFRGRREENSVQGVWYKLRRSAQTVPNLETLPTPVPDWLRDLLLAEELVRGGLIFVCGATGSGKTTLASAILVSRLEKFGGFASTIEDPPELPLNGWYPKNAPRAECTGYCTQNMLPRVTSHSDAWGEGIKGALRSQPAGARSMLFVGEIRDPKCAEAAIRAASTGFLVICTGFGSDIIGGLQTLSKQAASAGTDAELANDMLATCLKLVIHLQLINRNLVATALMNRNSTDGVAVKIRQGNYQHLQNDITQQANLFYNSKTSTSAKNEMRFR